jgi:NADPH:quinone reductase-like Zn-dependent oxidoreductase
MLTIISDRLWTAIQALFHTPRLALKEHKASDEPAPWILVYSGATSVGQFAIQLAHAYGYRVIATAAPKNFDFLKTLGADVVLDYNDADVSEKIKLATSDSLAFGLDTITKDDSFEKSVKSFGKNGGKLIPLLYPPVDARKWRKDVIVQGKSLNRSRRGCKLDE